MGHLIKNFLVGMLAGSSFLGCGYLFGNSSRKTDSKERTRIEKRVEEKVYPIVLDFTSQRNHEEAKSRENRTLEQKTQTSFVEGRNQERNLCPYYDLIDEKSRKYGLDGSLIAAQIEQESCFNPRAVSYCGALGLGQIMPGTARRFGYSAESMYTPKDNLEVETRYMHILLERYDDFPEDEREKLALASYNAGEGNIGHAINIIKNARNGEKTYTIERKNRKAKTINISEFSNCPENWDSGYSKALHLITGDSNSNQTIDYVKKIEAKKSKYNSVFGTKSRRAA